MHLWIYSCRDLLLVLRAVFHKGMIQGLEINGLMLIASVPPSMKGSRTETVASRQQLGTTSLCVEHTSREPRAAMCWFSGAAKALAFQLQ